MIFGGCGDCARPADPENPLCVRERDSECVFLARLPEGSPRFGNSVGAVRNRITRLLRAIRTLRTVHRLLITASGYRGRSAGVHCRQARSNAALLCAEASAPWRSDVCRRTCTSSNPPSSAHRAGDICGLVFRFAGNERGSESEAWERRSWTTHGLARAAAPQRLLLPHFSPSSYLFRRVRCPSGQRQDRVAQRLGG